MKKISTILWSYMLNKYFRHFTTRESLEKWQEKKLKKHFSFLRKQSPYFKNHLNQINEPFTSNVLKKLPIMDKTMMMDHFDELNTKKIKKEKAFKIALEAEKTRDFSPMIGDVTIGLSSGTSGNRGLFVVSEQERNQWAGTILAKLLPHGLFSKEKIAFFLRANSNLYESVSSKQIQFLFFDLLDDLDIHIKQLNKMKPTILVAPPSMLKFLSQQKEQGQLLISPIKIISVAEVLEPIEKAKIEEVFGQTLHQVYQCTEGFLASTCQNGVLHLNEDVVYIEKNYLDEEKSRFSPIITDFTRTTQPIIRYLLNDVLIIKKEGCSCGSVMTPIEQIEGRCDDIFYFLNEQKEEKPIFSDFIRRWIITSTDEVEEYRVIQHSYHEIEIQLKTKHHVSEIETKITDSITTFLKEKCLSVPMIHFTDYQPHQKGTKLKRVERRGL